MSDSIKVDLRGDKQLQRLLDELPTRSVKKGMRRAINLAATPILKAAKQNAPKATGLLRKSLKKKLKSFSNGVVIAIIGPDRKMSETKTLKNGKIVVQKPAKYAHLVEGGHGGKHAAGAHPFLKPAFDSNKDTAVKKAQAVLLETLESEARKFL